MDFYKFLLQEKRIRNSYNGNDLRRGIRHCKNIRILLLYYRIPSFILVLKNVCKDTPFVVCSKPFYLANQLRFYFIPLIPASSWYSGVTVTIGSALILQR